MMTSGQRSISPGHFKVPNETFTLEKNFRSESGFSTPVARLENRLKSRVTFMSFVSVNSRRWSPRTLTLRILTNRFNFMERPFLSSTFPIFQQPHPAKLNPGGYKSDVFVGQSSFRFKDLTIFDPKNPLSASSLSHVNMGRGVIVPVHLNRKTEEPAYRRHQPFACPHLARAACRAMRVLSDALRLLARALPPLLLPSLERAAACSFFGFSMIQKRIHGRASMVNSWSAE